MFELEEFFGFLGLHPIQGNARPIRNYLKHVVFIHRCSFFISGFLPLFKYSFTLSPQFLFLIPGFSCLFEILIGYGWLFQGTDFLYLIRQIFDLGWSLQGFHPGPCSRFIYCITRFIGKILSRNITVSDFSSSFQSLIGKVNIVMLFVLWANPLENQNRILHRRSFHFDWLEPTIKCWIFLDILAILS